MSQPIENLRKHHKPCESCIYTNHWFARTVGTHCQKCLDPWPCDTIAALDALEEGLHSLLDARPSRGQLMHRLDAATELIRKGMETAHILHFVKSTTWPDLAKPDIDTCENCRPYREWLAGDKEEHRELRRSTGDPREGLALDDHEQWCRPNGPTVHHDSQALRPNEP